MPLPLIALPILRTPGWSIEPGLYELLLLVGGAVILVGAVLDGPGENLTNTGIVWDPANGAGASYAKRHPVPFGEYMPLRSFFRIFSDQVDLLRRDFVAGEEPARTPGIAEDAPQVPWYEGLLQSVGTADGG